MAKAKTPSFIIELGLEVNAHDEAELNKRFEVACQLYNACLSEAKRRLDLLRQSKEYQQTRSMPKTINGKCLVVSTPPASGSRDRDIPKVMSSPTPEAGLWSKQQKKSNKERTEAFKALNAKFGFSEYDLHLYATEIRHSFLGDHIDSATTQKIASRAFKAVQRVAFGLAKKVRFKGKNQLKSVEGKTNQTGIRYNENTGHIEWNGLKLKCIIDVLDKVVVHGLSNRVKYCRIVKRIFDGKTRFFIQLILEGKPYQKFSAPDNIVGLDIGPSTIACVSKDKASLERFCDELSNKQKKIRRLQRKLDRQRRANNPQNYNPDGTIKPGKKSWYESK